MCWGIHLHAEVNHSKWIALPMEKIPTSLPFSTKFKAWVAAGLTYLLWSSPVLPYLHSMDSSEEPTQGWSYPLQHPARSALSEAKESWARTITRAESQMPLLPMSWPHGCSGGLAKFYVKEATLSCMSSRLGFHVLSAQYILWACASLGAMLVTPHFSQPSATTTQVTQSLLHRHFHSSGCNSFLPPLLQRNTDHGTAPWSDSVKSFKLKARSKKYISL